MLMSLFIALCQIYLEHFKIEENYLVGMTSMAKLGLGFDFCLR